MKDKRKRQSQVASHPLVKGELRDTGTKFSKQGPAFLESSLEEKTVALGGV